MAQINVAVSQFTQPQAECQCGRQQQPGIYLGGNLFGNGKRSNAAIGRAVYLIKANLYGSISQEMDKSTFGHPEKSSFCFAEDLETSPWPSLAESKSFRPGSSAVTMVAAAAPL